MSVRAATKHRPARINAYGPQKRTPEVIHRVRQAEARQAVATDDATIAHYTDLGEA